MAATLSTTDLSSPLAHSAERTALLLLDFQNFTIGLCTGGENATVNAAKLRDWALTQGILVMHSIVNANGAVPSTTKGATRISNMMSSLKGNTEAISEHSSLVFSSQSREYLSLKTPGIVSGMKADDCQQVFQENGIQSIIICGLSTSGAVLRTAVPATDEEYAVTIIEDACADRTTELHDMLMRDVLSSRANVITAAQLMEAWPEAK